MCYIIHTHGQNTRLFLKNMDKIQGYFAGNMDKIQG